MNNQNTHPLTRSNSTTNLYKSIKNKKQTKKGKDNTHPSNFYQQQIKKNHKEESKGKIVLPDQRQSHTLNKELIKNTSNSKTSNSKEQPIIPIPIDKSQKLSNTEQRMQLDKKIQKITNAQVYIPRRLVGVQMFSNEQPSFQTTNKINQQDVKILGSEFKIESVMQQQKNQQQHITKQQIKKIKQELKQVKQLISLIPSEVRKIVGQMMNQQVRKIVGQMMESNEDRMRKTVGQMMNQFKSQLRQIVLNGSQLRSKQVQKDNSQ